MGLPGMNGADGIDGAVGPQGPMGLTGMNGADGIDGIDGAVGPQGPIGLPGLDGADGIDGAVGPQGATGTFQNGTTAGEMVYWNGTAWVAVIPTVNEGATLQMIGGVPTWTGGVIPTPSATNPITGKIWMDRNLGASQVATSFSDAAAYGDLYQWGRSADGHQLRTSTTTAVLSALDLPGHADFITNTSAPNDWRSPQNDNLWQGINGVNNPCPTGYRIPTSTELYDERGTWASPAAADAYASPLKWVVGGLRQTDGVISAEGIAAKYWSSTVNGTSADNLYINVVAFPGNTADARAMGLPVRCIKD
jgi:uncharacterized protein (TIGR02145 family)